MKKRGTVILEFAIEILIGAIIFTALYSAGVQWGKGEIIKKINIAKDLGLTIGMLESSTVDTYVDYKRDISSYIIKIENNCVKVLLDVQDPSPSTYCFPPTKEIKTVSLVNPKKLIISKTNKGIIVSDKDLPKTDSDFCAPIADYQASLEFRIFIEPILDDLEEKEILLRITNSLYNTLKSKFERTETSLETIRSLQANKINEDKLKKLEKEADLIIKLQISKNDKKLVFAKFNYDQKKESLERMSSIACNSLNNLLNIKEVNFDSVSKLPANLPNPNMILFDVSDIIFSQQESKNRLIASEIGNKLGEGILDVLSE